MFANLFNTIIYNPLYNGLVLFIDIVPMADVGIAVILLTILVKVLLFPLAQKAARTQVILKKVQPEVDKLKDKLKEDKQEQARKIFELYKKHNVNPFFGFLVLFIQIPIVIGLYFVFYKGGLPNIDTALLYSFIPTPTQVNMLFLGLIPMDGKSVVLALLTGITQFINMQIVMPAIVKKDIKDGPNFKDDMIRSMQFQIKYFLPIIITVVAYMISSAVALYWVTSNIFTIGQELLVRKRLKKEEQND